MLAENRLQMLNVLFDKVCDLLPGSLGRWQFWLLEIVGYITRVFRIGLTFECFPKAE
jgi:hypothetical protein